MRILRLLVVGSVFGGSLLAIGFTCVDRLSHPAPGPVPTLVRAGLPEPVATGSLPSDDGAVFGPNAPEPGRSAATPSPKPAPAKAAAKPPVKKAVDGFDTERLNALMRGDPSVTLSRTR